ncbi:MAG TPA: hypothetical protein VF244_03230 [Acidimicrobiales bacterium]
MEAGIDVETAEGTVRLEPGSSLTFGRSAGCDLVLDADDLGISRLAGAVEWSDGTWFVANRSATRPLAVVDVLGFRAVLAPGARAAVDRGLSVVVEGQVRRHELRLAVEGEPSPAGVGGPGGLAGDGDDDAIPTEFGAEVRYTDEDRLALVALFAGYLRPFPRHDPRPRSYADAAADLGWPRTRLVKRVEYLRTRLSRAGVANLFGDRAMEGLAEHVIATGVIGRHDLEALDSRP